MQCGADRFYKITLYRLERTLEESETSDGLVPTLHNAIFEDFVCVLAVPKETERDMIVSKFTFVGRAIIVRRAQGLLWNVSKEANRLG